MRHDNMEVKQLRVYGIEPCGCLKHVNLRMLLKCRNMRTIDSSLNYLERSLCRLSNLNLHSVLKIPGTKWVSIWLKICLKISRDKYASNHPEPLSLSTF